MPPSARSSPSKKEPLTGYGACQAMVGIIETQQASLRARQKLPAAQQKGLVADIHNLARSCAVVQAELRKTHDDAARALKSYPLEQQVELMLGMIKKLPPEYRKAIGDYVAELGEGFLT